MSRANSGAFPIERIHLDSKGFITQTHKEPDRSVQRHAGTVRARAGDCKPFQLEHETEDSGIPVTYRDFTVGTLITLGAIGLIGLALWGYGVVRAAVLTWDALT